MITITDLTKSYGKKPVLCGLSMTVNTGEVYGFLGENGAGKSTTMNILTGLLKKDGGTILLDGKEPGPDEIPSIGYLPESPEFFDYMTCREYFRYIAAACGYEGDIDQRSREVIETVGLSAAADRKIKGFSRGMKQRVGIGCAMYSGKDILLLDEPTSALDPQGRAEVMEIIEKLKAQGKTVILSTHILSDVERVADRIGILSGGKLILEGSIAELLAQNGKPIINFTLADPAQAPEEEFAQKLRALPFVTEVRRDGARCSVSISGDFAEGNRALFAFLGREGLTIESYAVAHPTLESIYIKEVSRHEAAKGWH